MTDTVREPVSLPSVEAMEALEPCELATLAQALADRLMRAVACLSTAAGTPARPRQRPRASRLDDCVTVAEAARIACVSPATIRDWLYKRKLASVKVGGRVCIRRRDLEAWATVRQSERWAP